MRLFTQMLRRYWLLCGITLVSFAWSWKAPLLNAHSYRQTQTAQTAQIFLEEGWHPMLTKVRFFGKPGYTVLEFPLYQTLDAGLARLTPFSLEQSGRIISFISALFLAWGVLFVYRFSDPGNPLVMPSEFAATLLLTSPLLFATSQWVTIEVLNAALGVWAYIAFINCFKNCSWNNIASLFVLSMFSITVKPTVLFAILPIFVYTTYQAVYKNPEKFGTVVSWKNLLKIASAFLLTAILAQQWFKYCNGVNRQQNASFVVSGSMSHLMFGEHQLYQPAILVRIAERFILYTVGPGTILWAMLSLTQFGFKRFCEHLRKYRGWVLICGACLLLYFSIFTGANYFHSYYQVPIVFPIYLLLFLVIPWQTNRRMHAIWMLAVLINAGSSIYCLMRQDRDWATTVNFLQKKIAPGSELPELVLVSNWEASAPVLGYYLGRYLREKPISELVPSDLKGKSWLAVCDESIDAACSSIFENRTYKPADMAHVGRLKIFIGGRS